MRGVCLDMAFSLSGDRPVTVAGGGAWLLACACDPGPVCVLASMREGWGWVSISAGMGGRQGQMLTIALPRFQ